MEYRIVRDLRRHLVLFTLPVVLRKVFFKPQV